MATVTVSGYDRSGAIDALAFMPNIAVVSGEDDALSADWFTRLNPAVMLDGVDETQNFDAFSRFALGLALTGEDTADSGDAWVGRVLTFGALVDVASSDDIGQTGTVILVDGTEAAASDDVLVSTGVSVDVAGDDAALSEDVVLSLAGLDLAGEDMAASDDLGELGVIIPFVREPVGTELRGAVNLARNPNVQYAFAGLTDWTSDADITLDRNADVEAWVGVESVEATIDAGAGTPEITVASQDALLQEGFGRRWVAAIQLLDEFDVIAPLDLLLRLTYTDATSDDGSATTVDVTDEWLRYATEPVEQDAAKVLDRLDLVVAVPQDAVDPLALRLGAVQFEEVSEGGATAYTDGDLGDGSWWTGTPGLSMSVRDTA